MPYIKYEAYKLYKNIRVLFLLLIFAVLPLVAEAGYNIYKKGVNHSWIETDIYVMLILFVVMIVSTIEMKSAMTSTLLVNGNRLYVYLTKGGLIVTLATIIATFVGEMAQIINGVNIFNHGRQFLTLIGHGFLIYLTFFSLAWIVYSRMWLFLIYFVFSSVIAFLLNSTFGISLGLVPIESISCFAQQSDTGNAATAICKWNATGLFFYNLALGIILFLIGLFIFKKRDIK